jgi:hypothetical protein
MQKDKLYRCLDKLLAHKRDFFSCLKGRWQLLFHARFDILGSVENIMQLEGSSRYE